MKKWYLSFLLLSMNASPDPFFGENSPKDKIAPDIVNSQSKKNKINMSDCKSYERNTLLNLPVEFEKLKLIGLIKNKDKVIALFIDNNEKLISLKEQDLISNQYIEIININFHLHSITYIDWKASQNCDLPDKVTLML